MRFLLMHRKFIFIPFLKETQVLIVPASLRNYSKLWFGGLGKCWWWFVSTVFQEFLWLLWQHIHNSGWLVVSNFPPFGNDQIDKYCNNMALKHRFQRLWSWQGSITGCSVIFCKLPLFANALFELVQMTKALEQTGRNTYNLFCDKYKYT